MAADVAVVAGVCVLRASVFLLRASVFLLRASVFLLRASFCFPVGAPCLSSCGRPVGQLHAGLSLRGRLGLGPLRGRLGLGPSLLSPSPAAQAASGHGWSMSNQGRSARQGGRTPPWDH